MRVLQVVPTLSAGGAETLVAELALALGRRGHTVGVALLAGARGARGTELVDKLEQAGIVVSGRALRSPRRPGAALSLARAIGSFKPDVIHSHLYSADLVLAAVNAVTARQRLIRTIHNTSIQGTRSRAGTWLLDRLFATSVGCGERVADAYERYFGGKQKSALATVRNGVTRTASGGTSAHSASHPDAATDRTRLHAALGISPGAFLFVHVGAFRGRTLASSQKAHDVLLLAFAQLCAQPAATNAHLLLIGDGELRSAAQQFARTLGVANRITFAGAVGNVPRYLAAADAFVFPSRYEGLPVALIEACMAGVPTIASELPEIAEVFGGNAYTSAPVDEPPRFAAAMLACLLDPDTARAQAAANAAHVSHEFSIDLCAARYETHYAQLDKPRASRTTHLSSRGKPPGAGAPPLPKSAADTLSKRSHQETP
jgi:glycosyltransferase involved in cell wall biosynthesis